MSGITWLHLSDWHQKGPDFDRKVVRDALIKDIRDRATIDSALQKVDFVMFSGDLAFSGRSVEYEAARHNLLDPVLEAVGLKTERLFIVPGNHDFDREYVYDMLPPELQKPLDSDDAVQKWLTDDARRSRTLEPFKAYREFVSSYTGQPTPDFASIVRIEVGDTRVALLGVNSAWMCGRNKDANGKINDRGYALIGGPQIHEALASIADADIKLVVQHHPFDWLAEFDRAHIEGCLTKTADFMLYGHQHVPEVRIVKGTSGDCIIVPVGTCYERRTPKNSRYANSYNFVHLSFSAKKGTVYLRRWSEGQHKWIEDIDVCARGNYPFDLPKTLIAAPAAPSSARATSPSLSLEAAERRYRDILLETCDIIDLVGLGEQDRHIAQRQLELRRLYVPLRAWVEATAGGENGEAHRDEKLWGLLEQRRAVNVRGGLGAEYKQRVSIGERLAKSKRLVVLGVCRTFHSKSVARNNSADRRMMR